MMAHHMLQKDETAQLQKVFQKLDKDCDARLLPNEFQQAFTEYVPGVSQSEVENLFNLVDTNKNGKIEFSEFVAAGANRNKLLTDGNLNEGFKYFDKDNNGYIDLDEIKEVFSPKKSKGKKLDDLVCQKIMSRVDTDQEGKLKLKEFKLMMQSLLDKPSKKAGK